MSFRKRGSVFFEGKSYCSTNEEEDNVIVLSDDDEELNKCMICYCTLTDSQLSRVKALTIDSSDSTNIFNNYCRLLNIVLLKSMQWDFENEHMPFCSGCLAMVKTLAQLSDKLTSIKNQINAIVDIIKSEIVKSKKENNSKLGNGKEKFSTSSEKVDHCRNEAIKDEDEATEIIPKKEKVSLTQDCSDMHVENYAGTCCNPHNQQIVNTNQSDIDIYPVGSMYSCDKDYRKPATRTAKSYRSKKNFPIDVHSYPNIQEQIRQVSSTQHGHSSEDSQPSTKRFTYGHSNEDVAFASHSVFSDSLWQSSSQPLGSEGIAYEKHHVQNYLHKTKSISAASLFMENESEMLKMEDTAEFETYQLKETVLNSTMTSLTRSEEALGQPLSSQIHIDEGEWNRGTSEILEDDGSAFVNMNIQIIENTDQKGPYKCKVCERRFTTRNSATTHIQAVHLKVKKIQCKFCTKTFFKKFNCIVHINKIHLKGGYTDINPESAVVYLVD